jgi:hypothetical protein
MARRWLQLAAGLLVASARVVSGQACAEPHYRWSEKIDTSLASGAPDPVDVSDVLTAWAPRQITGKDRCARRIGREKKVYVVTGWVRRIKTQEADSDWHVEITEEEDAIPVSATCMIVEIPHPMFGDIYRDARAQLVALVDTTSLGKRGDLSQAVQVRFTGVAFFDGVHQSRPRGGGPPRARSHGRCNSSVRALWELHPVYKVEAPEEP